MAQADRGVALRAFSRLDDCKQVGPDRLRRGGRHAVGDLLVDYRRASAGKLDGPSRTAMSFVTCAV
jgi:hypothetical protein